MHMQLLYPGGDLGVGTFPLATTSVGDSYTTPAGLLHGMLSPHKF